MAIDFRQHPRYSNIVCSSDGRVFVQRKAWRRGGHTGNNYLAIDWWTGPIADKKNRVIEYVHRLVAETFGEQVAGMDVDHADFNPDNNAVTNLSAQTPGMNRRHNSRE